MTVRTKLQPQPQPQPQDSLTPRTRRAESDRKPLAQRGLEAFYDESNLQGLCKPCHDIKTRRGE